MNKLLKILMLTVLVATASMSRSGVARAAAGPFTCSSNFYQVISGQLELLNPLTGMYSIIAASPGYDYNAIGYNVLDNYIYGIVQTGAQTGDLIRVASDGSITDLGVPAGLPASGYVNGSFDLAGNLYIHENNNNVIYKINVGSMTTTTLTISGATIVNGDDNVFINNNLYLLVGQTLSIVNLNNDSATNVTVSGPSGWLNGGDIFGAGWSDQAGELFFSNNASGAIYQINNLTSSTPTATFEVAGTATPNNDGASCPLAAQNPFAPPIANNDSYTTPFNTPLNETAISVLNNDVGNALTVTSNTNPAHGTVSVNANGTFLYTPDKGFSGTDSFNYTVTDAFGRTASATVTIAVSPASAPSTGFGTPQSSNSAIIELGLGAIVSIAGGLGLLYRQKRIKFY